MKSCIILAVLSAIAAIKIKATLNEKGKMVAHPFARLQMLVQSVLYTIYA